MKNTMPPELIATMIRVLRPYVVRQTVTVQGVKRDGTRFAGELVQIYPSDGGRIEVGEELIWVKDIAELSHSRLLTLTAVGPMQEQVLA